MLHQLLRSLRRLTVQPVIGPRGERAAARHLKARGYRILARNLRHQLGEIDLLAEAPDQRTLVIVEVKSGSGAAAVPEWHVNPAKQRKLTSLAAAVTRRRALHARPIRFDVVAVTFEPGRKPAIRHHVAAFESHL